ncbi:MAG: oxidoreductase [Verrucomicrobia bacterium]|nr:oxidoreductase [Verrucomicrobiota bacterium]
MQKTPKKDRYRIGVIGAGAIGLDHIRGFQLHPAAEVVAVADTSAERARQAAEEFGLPEAVLDYAKILSRDDIDVVSIALPNYLHAPVALQALRQGKHVLLEKPMATSGRDAALLVAEARKQRRLLMVGQNLRFDPEVQTARQLVTRGVLGDVYHAKTSWSRRSGIPRIGSWFTQRKFSGGGGLYDIGVHALDRCLYVVGDFDAAAVSGSTFAKFGPQQRGDGDWGKSEIDPRRPFDVDDLAVALIKLRSGRTVLLECAWACHQPLADVNGSHLFGTEAGLSLPNLQVFRNGENGYVTEAIRPLPPLVHPNRMHHFIDCLLGEATPFVPMEESLAVQRILDAIYRSAQTGREVRLPAPPARRAKP